MDLTQEDWINKQTELKGSIILDVRTEEEFENGHIVDAQLLDIRNPQEFMEGLAALDPSKNYFVYCRSGARSAQACLLMQQQGFNAAFNLSGGILAWNGPLV